MKTQIYLELNWKLVNNIAIITERLTRLGFQSLLVNINLETNVCYIHGTCKITYKIFVYFYLFFIYLMLFNSCLQIILYSIYTF